MNPQLTIVYEWSEDGWWVARVAGVPGAISQGKSKAEAKENVLDAFNELMIARRDLAMRAGAKPEDVESVSFLR